MGETYTNYNLALNYLASERLSDRRSKLCLAFALKCEKNLRYQDWFMVAEVNDVPLPNTRSDKSKCETKYKPVPTRTDRYNDSPIPYLTALLNSHYNKK